MTLYYKLSSEILHARDRVGLTQEQAAEALDISVRWYQRLEKGERFPGAVLLLRILVLFGIDAEIFKDDVGLVAIKQVK